MPLPIRLFEQTARAHVGNAISVIIGAAYLYAQTGIGADVDRQAIISLGMLLEFVLLSNVARQARTLGKLGFDHAALRRGFTAILEEGAEARAQGLAVPGVARRRRMRLVFSPLMVVIGIYNIRNGLNARVANESGGFSISSLGSMNLISGAGAVVVAVLLVLLDSYRTPILQRVAHLFWRSAAGRLLLLMHPVLPLLRFLPLFVVDVAADAPDAGVVHLRDQLRVPGADGLPGERVLGRRIQLCVPGRPRRQRRELDQIGRAHV